MTVRVYCVCGADVTDDIPSLDRKTRTLEWFDHQPLLCVGCRRDRGLIIQRDEAGRRTIAIEPRRS